MQLVQFLLTVLIVLLPVDNGFAAANKHGVTSAVTSESLLTHPSVKKTNLKGSQASIDITSTEKEERGSSSVVGGASVITPMFRSFSLPVESRTVTNRIYEGNGLSQRLKKWLENLLHSENRRLREQQPSDPK